MAVHFAAGMLFFFMGYVGWESGYHTISIVFYSASLWQFLIWKKA